MSAYSVVYESNTHIVVDMYHTAPMAMAEMIKNGYESVAFIDTWAVLWIGEE